MLTYHKGNVINAFLSHKGNAILLHGCNCFHAMNSGIAKELRRRIPLVKENDDLTPFGDVNKLGTVSLVTEQALSVVGVSLPIEFKAIGNCYTQYEPGPNFEYQALRDCLVYLSVLLGHTFDDTVLFLPKIGAGIGKGHWPTIEQILKQFSDNLNADMRIYTLEK